MSCTGVAAGIGTGGASISPVVHDMSKECGLSCTLLYIALTSTFNGLVVAAGSDSYVVVGAYVFASVRVLGVEVAVVGVCTT